MHASELDGAAVAVLRTLAAADVQFVLLEDEDRAAVTLVPAPASRNLRRLVRALKHLGTRMDGTRRRPDFDELVRTAPSRWPLAVGDVTLDLVRVGIDDGRWSAYFEEAEAVELRGGLQVDVVADEPILPLRRGDAIAAIPELALTRRERERVRRQRREQVRKDERRSSRRAALGRFAHVR